MEEDDKALKPHAECTEECDGLMGEIVSDDGAIEIGENAAILNDRRWC